jgi:hypothetical protein
MVIDSAHRSCQTSAWIRSAPPLQASSGRIHNLIEPPQLIAHFLTHPPQDFQVWTFCDGIPAFSARFDLLTTMEPADRRRLEAWPLYHWWRRWLRPPTAFVGTTCTEYAPLPNTAIAAFVDELLQRALPSHSFVIIKDIPCDAALVDDAAMQANRALIACCEARGCVLVEGQALAYVPIDFDSIDIVLARLTSARRKNIRRKLKSAANVIIETVPTGASLFQGEAVLDELYTLYLNVYAQSELHFDLLTRQFFRALLQDADSGGVVFTYRANGALIGYNLCYVHRGMLLDKYIGLAYPEAREHNLYVVSWFHNLDFARKHGLRCYVAGWTDPEVKRSLGARFTFTRHAVYVRNPLLRLALRPFKRFFEADTQWQQQTR